MVINAVIGGGGTGGGTRSTLVNISEWVINGKKIILNTPSSGGSGGGGSGLMLTNGASAGTPFNATYSKLNAGFNGTSTQGGNGGSSSSFLGIPVRYIEL